MSKLNQLNINAFLDQYRTMCIDSDIKQSSQDNELAFLQAMVSDIFFKSYTALFGCLAPSKICDILMVGLFEGADCLLRQDDETTLSMRQTYKDAEVNFFSEVVFNHKNKYVEYSELDIVSPETNMPLHQGLGTQFLSNSFYLYDKIGLDHIDIPIVYDIGIRAWPKMGFRLGEAFFQNAVIPLMNGQLQKTSSLSVRKKECLQEAMDAHGSLFLAYLSRKEPDLFEHCVSIIARGSSKLCYHADLQDQKQRALFEAYFERKNTKKVSAHL